MALVDVIKTMLTVYSLRYRVFNATEKSHSRERHHLMDVNSGPRENVNKVRDLLLRRIRVILRDGRVVEGTLECVDSYRNLVLRSAVDMAGPHSLGLVVVPGDAHVSVYARIRKQSESSVPFDALQLTERYESHSGADRSSSMETAVEMALKEGHIM